LFARRACSCFLMFFCIWLRLFCNPLMEELVYVAVELLPPDFFFELFFFFEEDVFDLAVVFLFFVVEVVWLFFEVVREVCAGVVSAKKSMTDMYKRRFIE